MSYLIINDDFNSLAYNLFTRGITLGLGSDYIRSLQSLSYRDTVTYNEYGFWNEWGCFSPDAERFYRLFDPKPSFFQKVMEYLVKISNKDSRVVWFYRKFFSSKNSVKIIYKVINKASPKFGSGLMNTTTIDFPIKVSYKKDNKELFPILFITFNSSKIIDIKILGVLDPKKDGQLYMDNKDSLGYIPIDTDLANIINEKDYAK